MLQSRAGSTPDFSSSLQTVRRLFVVGEGSRLLQGPWKGNDGVKGVCIFASLAGRLGVVEVVKQSRVIQLTGPTAKGLPSFQRLALGRLAVQNLLSCLQMMSGRVFWSAPDTWGMASFGSSAPLDALPDLCMANFNPTGHLVLGGTAMAMMASKMC